MMFRGDRLGVEPMLHVPISLSWCCWRMYALWQPYIAWPGVSWLASCLTWLNFASPLEKIALPPLEMAGCCVPLHMFAFLVHLTQQVLFLACALRRSCVVFVAERVGALGCCRCGSLELAAHLKESHIALLCSLCALLHFQPGKFPSLFLHFSYLWENFHRLISPALSYQCASPLGWWCSCDWTALCPWAVYSLLNWRGKYGWGSVPVTWTGTTHRLSNMTTCCAWLSSCGLVLALCILLAPTVSFCKQITRWVGRTPTRLVSHSTVKASSLWCMSTGAVDLTSMVRNCWLCLIARQRSELWHFK